MDTRCVQCGFCCTKWVCPYGLIDDVRQACIFLSESNYVGQRKCMLYDLIKKHVKDWHLCPAFEAGCSITLLNSARDKVINILTKRGNSTMNSNHDCQLLKEINVY